MSFIIAIDGPAGTGKTTISKLVAESFGLIRIDTGAMYRCVAYEILKSNIDLKNMPEILKILDNIDIELRGELVFLNKQDVTSAIRSKEVTNCVSPVSAIKEIRYKLVEMQRKLAENKNVVMEGRDIGTYVFPNANVKIYLDASIEERAKRRCEENKLKNIDNTYEEVKNNIEVRDETDRTKEMGALKIAEDAIIIDTSNLTLEQVKQKIVDIVRQKMN